MGRSKELFEEEREKEQIDEDFVSSRQQELDEWYENHIEEMYESFKERQGYEQAILQKEEKPKMDRLS